MQNKIHLIIKSNTQYFRFIITYLNGTIPDQSGSYISNIRQGILRINNTKTIKITCSVPCPVVKEFNPRITWYWNGQAFEKVSVISTTNRGSKTIDNYTITSGFYKEEVMVDISNRN